MATIKRSGEGVKFKTDPEPVRVSQPEASELPPPELLRQLDEPPGPQFREECKITKSPRVEPKDIIINGMVWTPMDKDREGNPHSYICEPRAMKVAVNMRAERGEIITPRTEWILIRMGEIIFSSTNLTTVFETAARS